MSGTDSETFNIWRKGHGPIVHREETVERVRALAWSSHIDPQTLYRMLAAADRLASAAMWTVVHMTYAKRVDLSGVPPPADAFKTTPEGHTGGSLNMVPAFVGYLTANAISATTCSWLMGQGHCVVAIEAVNALTGDVSAAQTGRYHRSERGLSQLAADFYSELGRFRIPRDSIEAAFTAREEDIAALFPAGLPPVIVSHTRPEPMLGLLRRIDSHGRLRAAVSAGAARSMFPACCSPTAAPGRIGLTRRSLSLAGSARRFFPSPSRMHSTDTATRRAWPPSRSESSQC